MGRGVPGGGREGRQTDRDREFSRITEREKLRQEKEIGRER